MTEVRVKDFADILSKDKEFPREWHMDYAGLFNGYVRLNPHTDSKNHRPAFVRFMKSNSDFEITSTETKDILCVLKYNNEGEVSFGAAVAMFDAGVDLYCYIYLIKTDKEHRGEHLASTFIEDVVALAQTQVKPNAYLYIAAGMSESHRPNGFFLKMGFTERAPEHMRDWKQNNCHCMMFRSVKHQVIERQLIEEQKSAKVSAKQSSVSKAISIPQQQLDLNELESISVAGSKVTVTTTKTKNGALDKHCTIGDCHHKKVSGANWARHVREHVEMGVPKQSVAPQICSGQCCALCAKSVATTESRHGVHRKVVCSICNVAKQSFHIDKASGKCNVCVKKPSTIVNAQTTPLTKSALAQLQQQQQPVPVAIQQDLQIDTRSNLKRSFVQIEDQYQDDAFDVPLLPPLKKVKTDAPPLVQQTNVRFSIDTPMKELSTAHSVESSSVSKANPCNLHAKLMEIENSTKSEYVLSVQVSKVCAEFSTLSGVGILRTGSYNKLAGIISMILSQQSSQLSTAQLTGLFIAAFTLQGQCWTNAVQMMSLCSEDHRENIITVFGAHIRSIYSDPIADWSIAYWRNITEQQLNMMKLLKWQQHSTDLLFISLVVQVDEPEFFVDFVSTLLGREFMSLVLESIKSILTQPKLSTEQLIDLTQLVQQPQHIKLLQSESILFASVPLNQWHEKIEQLKASCHLVNSDSIQAAISEYITTYGDIEKTFTTDLFAAADSYIGLVLHESDNKPNAKQLGLAQYCIGALRKANRQLWSVPSGQGKSRIIAFATAIAINLEMFSKVHIAFENEHLRARDHADFESLWILLNCEDKIEYHTGYNFTANEGELIIVDESDTAMFSSPQDFAKLVDGRVCICFTATPDNCDAKGVEARVVQALQFKQFNYTPNAERVDAAKRLEFDDIHHAVSIDEKAKFISSLLVNGSVLVYGPQELYDKLVEAEAPIIVINKEIDYKILRQLDQQPFRVLFAIDQFGMRGLDYRSEKAILCLVVAQGFDCTREALQGVARVGRFGDSCRKIRFNDVELVDKTKQLKYNSKLLGYVAELSKKVVVKTVVVKSATQPAAKKNGGYSNLAKRQVSAALQSGNQTQLSFDGYGAKKVPTQAQLK